MIQELTVSDFLEAFQAVYQIPSRLSGEWMVVAGTSFNIYSAMEYFFEILMFDECFAWL